MSSLRGIIAYSIVTFFILYVLVAGLSDSPQGPLNDFADSSLESDTFSSEGAFPDFGKFVQVQTLSPKEFPIDDPKRRTIVIGDIHGMYSELVALLDKVSYDPRHDTLVSVGDILAKGPHDGSVAVLSYMARNNITAVRGNHDQKAIEWRSWINWIRSISGGKRWLTDLDAKFIEFQKSLPAKDREDDDIIEDWVDKQDKKRSGNDRKWWNKVPKGWKLYGDHYRIALAMSDEEYVYLLNKPLKLHVPHAHTFLVHAGFLSSDPTKDPDHDDQPLARVPVLPQGEEAEALGKRKKILRRLQEISMMEDVPQNMVPYLTQNMRSVLKDGTVVRDKDGQPWSELFNKDVKLCQGFDAVYSAKFGKHKKSLPCYPATVLYGHAASRGLDVKRWTVGLDSGCVYERRMTALVLGGKYAKYSLVEDNDTSHYEEESDLDTTEDDDDYPPEFGAFDKHNKKKKSVVRFGDHGRGRIVSVPCS